MKKHPIVVLVGRPNVGKSALFNRIANTIRALIYDQPGVTRDILQDICTWHDTTFTIVDTPGLDSLLHQKDSITQEAIIEAEKTTQNASLIVYVIDGKEGITKTDEILLRKFQKLQKPICIALNKTDIKDAEDTRYDIKGLGFSEITSVSASHGKGISDLLDSIIYMINTNTNYNNDQNN
jgi:GTP-binding protein